MHYFCLDIGGTSTRGAVFTPDGVILARAQSVGGALSLGAERAETAIRDVWQKICDAVSTAPDTEMPMPAQVKIFAGIAGYSLPGLADDLGNRLSDFAHGTFFSDGYGALLSATNGKPGALISVGTGVTALRLNEAGETLSISGWGFPAGDLGSGMWLGLQLTGALTKHLDGIVLSPSPSPSLIAAALKIIGTDPDRFMAWQTSAKPRAYASLAPLIVDHAAGGDVFCQQMLGAAAREIVDLANALYGDEKGLVHLAGGLGEILLPYCTNLGPRFEWQADEIDPVSGIYLLASGQAPRIALLPRPRLADFLAKQ